MLYNVEILNRDGTLVAKYENVKIDYVDVVVVHFNNPYKETD